LGLQWESLKRSPDPLAGFRGPTFKGRRKGGTAERERRRGEEGTGETPFSEIPGSAPGQLQYSLASVYLLAVIKFQSLTLSFSPPLYIHVSTVHYKPGDFLNTRNWWCI